MPDYTRNFQNTVGGHTGADAPMTVKSSSGQIADMINARDMISAIVGAGGLQNLLPADRAAVSAALISYLGKPNAIKMLDQINIFNQRSDMIAKNPAQRIDSFYTMGSRDPDVDNIIKKTKQLSEGPISDVSQTPNELTKKVAAGISVTDPIVMNAGNQSQVQQAKTF